MQFKVRTFLSVSLAVVLASCGGSDPEATPIPEVSVAPTVVATPSPEPTVPTPVPAPTLTGILNAVPDAFDFVREGVYRGGDGVGGAAWFDYDNDGDLDLYIANTKTEPNALFRNDQGIFTDVAEEAGVTNGEGNSGVAAADINNDGCADLFLSGEGGAIGSRWSAHKLYVNNCDGTFTDASEGSGIVVPEGVWSAAFGDINGDGLLDLFVGGVSGLFGGDFRPGPNEIYLNNGNATFEPVSVTAGLTTQSNTCGVAISDYNGDGMQDLFTANCGRAETPELWRSNGDMTYTDVAGEAGIGRESGGTWERQRPRHNEDALRRLRSMIWTSTSLPSATAMSCQAKSMIGFVTSSGMNNGDGTYRNVAELGRNHRPRVWMGGELRRLRQ